MKNILTKLRIQFPWIDDAFAFIAIISIALSLILFTSCKTTYVPIETDTKVVYKDSTIIEYRDTVIEVPIPYEKVVEVVPKLDTLHMETSVASAIAYLDPFTATLRGSITNKATSVPKTIYLPSEKEFVYRDSTVYKDRPIEVEKIKYKYNKFFYFLLSYFIITLTIMAKRLIAI